MRRLKWLVVGVAIPALTSLTYAGEASEPRLAEGGVVQNINQKADAPRTLPGADGGALAKQLAEPAPIASYVGGIAPHSDAPALPPYAWPAYTPYNNYASLAYQTQYPSGAWPFIGPPHPYPMIPSGWRSVNLRWHGGYWWLKFRAH